MLAPSFPIRKPAKVGCRVSPTSVRTMSHQHLKKGAAMSLIQDFKEFAMRGNVVDMAVGVIMGGAFGKIVSSLVADVLTPPIGYLTGGIKFENLAYKFPKM